MPRYFLTRLAVEGFRGINNENDPLDITFRSDVVNSLFAVNGHGKSSLFESLFYAIHGSIPKLNSLHAQERPQDYYCNRFHSGNAATILLEFAPDDGTPSVSIQVVRTATGDRVVTSPSGHSDPEGFLAALKEAFALLDHKTFAQFIEDSPLERGRTFSALLGLAEYSDCRQTLQAASDSRSFNTDFDIRVLTTENEAAQREALQALVTVRSTYEKVTETPLVDLDTPDECALKVTAALGSVELLKPHVVDKALSEIDFDMIKSAIKAAEGGEKRRQLETLLASIAAHEALGAHDLTVLASEQHRIRALMGERDKLLIPTRGGLFKRLYESANDVIDDGIWPDDKKCPLCESTLSSSISNHVNEQLQQYTAAATKAAEMNDVWATSVWRRCLSGYEAAPSLALNPQECRASLLDTNFSSGAISRDQLDSAVEWTSDLAKRVVAVLTVEQDKKSVLEKELPPSLVQLIEQIEYGRQFKIALNLYRERKKEQATLRARLAIREQWRKFITDASAIFSRAEEALSKSRIDGIDKQYKAMFQGIMQVKDVVPDLQRADDREDLHVRLRDFHGLRGLSARALLSESYRNALAIFVFLVAALKHSGAPRFVVLDDVTSSFDAGHQFTLLELIRTQLQQPQTLDGLQFIILSHDGLLEKYFDRLSHEGVWHHNKLEGLPPTGAILHRSQGADRLKQRIESHLNSGEISQAEPLIRQYLEYKLQQIVRKVSIAVPIDFAMMDTSRMVQNCLDAITSAVDLHKRAGTLGLDSRQIRDIDSIHVPAIIGNYVSHYETGASSSISVAVLRGVVTSIDELADCFRYDDTSGGSIVRKWYRSLSGR